MVGGWGASRRKGGNVCSTHTYRGELRIVPQISCEAVPEGVAVPAFATGLLDLRRWRKMMDGDEWRAELTRAEESATLAQLRTQTGRGRPLGSDSFLSKVEKVVGRRVRPLPVGRPKKER